MYIRTHILTTYYLIVLPSSEITSTTWLGTYHLIHGATWLGWHHATHSVKSSISRYYQVASEVEMTKPKGSRRSILFISHLHLSFTQRREIPAKVAARRWEAELGVVVMGIQNPLGFDQASKASSSSWRSSSLAIRKTAWLKRPGTTEQNQGCSRPRTFRKCANGRVWTSLNHPSPSCIYNMRVDGTTDAER